MFVANKKIMQDYDQMLLEIGYSIEELVDKASDTAIKYCLNYNRIILFCGYGNNGADGLSLALKLNQLDKEVLVIINQRHGSKAYEYYLNKIELENISIIELNQGNIEEIIHIMNNYDLLIDAIFGFGLNRPIDGLNKIIVQTINQNYIGTIISLDIPSGMQCDYFEIDHPMICGAKTITFSALKDAFLHPESKMFTGEVFVEILDVESIYNEIHCPELILGHQIKSLLKPKKYNGYKNQYGHPLLIVGSNNYVGAAILSSSATMHSGCGLVSVYSTSEVNRQVVQTQPEVITILRQQTISKTLLNHQVILIGSGLGLNDDSKQMLQYLLLNYTGVLVIDGDAITILSKHLDWLLQTHAKIILTPHLGEFKRLVGIIEIDNLAGQLQKFCAKYNLISMIKGPNTYISDGKKIYRNTSGNKAMAVAGMGDVLAGMVTSYVAQGYLPFESAILGVYIHGQCGDIIAKDNYVVLPSKLISQIPKLMQQIIEKTL